MSSVYRGFGSRHPADFFGLKRGVFQRDRLPDYALPVFDGIVASFDEPFKGITSDGALVPDLYPIVETGVSSAQIVEAAKRFVASLTSEQRPNAVYAVDAEQWRHWTNAYPLWTPHGLLLGDLERAQRELALGVLAASLSARGFADARRAMLFNDILADLCGDRDRDSLGEWIYFFAIFGTPSTVEPWGWQLWGHHLDISCFVFGGQIVMTPTFIGAEPAVIDDGPHAGLTILQRDRQAGLQLLQALSSKQQEQAILYRSMLTADLPPELTHPTEGRHRAGQGHDNLIYPYEGVRADTFSSGQRKLLLDLVECYVGRMPSEHAGLRLAEVERHIEETYFAWIGQPEGAGAFYYKVHSPVIIVEYDNHTGVFLDNPEPEAFHIHTLVRTPNGNDYGRDLLRQHYERSHGGAEHHPVERAHQHQH